MKVKQSLSILFYLFRQKKNKDGRVPIYVRITIDGDEAETSLGQKIHPDDWDNDKKYSRKKDQEAKDINSAIDKARADLKRHFDVLEAQHPYVTAEMLKKAYTQKTTSKEESAIKQENETFSQVVDELVREYLTILKKERVLENPNYKRYDRDDKIRDLTGEKRKIIKQVELARENANKLFDNPERTKTILNAVDEFLLNFVELVIAGKRAYTTLNKWTGTKVKITELIRSRYKTTDLPLPIIELKFATHMEDYLIPTMKLEANTAMKHIKNTKQIFERAVDNGWIERSPIDKFKCPYKDPEPEILTMHDVVKMIKYDFGKIVRLDRVRDFFIFCCFTGFAFTDAMNLTHDDIIIGIDNREWITTSRIKTKNPETVPLLPIVKKLIEKYVGDPRTSNDNRLFPKISLDCFNGYLKEIGALCKIKIELSSHRARYFFANVVTHDNGIQIKTVGKMLGQKKLSTTERYVRASTKNISDSMKIVEKKLFSASGDLKALQGGKRVNEGNMRNTPVLPISGGLWVTYKKTPETPIDKKSQE